MPEDCKDRYDQNVCTEDKEPKDYIFFVKSLIELCMKNQQIKNSPYNFQSVTGATLIPHWNKLSGLASARAAVYPPYDQPQTPTLLLSTKCRLSLKYSVTSSWSEISIVPSRRYTSCKSWYPWPLDPRPSIWVTM